MNEKEESAGFILYESEKLVKEPVNGTHEPGRVESGFVIARPDTRF